MPKSADEIRNYGHSSHVTKNTLMDVIKINQRRNHKATLGRTHRRQLAIGDVRIAGKDVLTRTD